KPRSSGSMKKTPRLSVTSSCVILGIWKSVARTANVCPFLLRVQLDDELFGNRGVDLGTLRPLQDGAGEPVVVCLQPRRDGGGQVGRVADYLLRARPGLQRDDVV